MRAFNLASELANAKDLTDVLSIQSRHAQTQLQSYALQAQELSRLMVEAAQTACSRSRRVDRASQRTLDPQVAADPCTGRDGIVGSSSVPHCRTKAVRNAGKTS